VYYQPILALSTPVEPGWVGGTFLDSGKEVLPAHTGWRQKKSPSSKKKVPPAHARNECGRKGIIKFQHITFEDQRKHDILRLYLETFNQQVIINFT
jgi:hypothetical protein